MPHGRKPLNYVYLDGKNGDDSKSGMTASDGVKTFARAKELLADSAYKGIISRAWSPSVIRRSGI